MTTMNFSEPTERRAEWGLLLIFALLSLGIVAGGAFYYRHYERQFRVAAERQLSAIAELKVGELAQYRKERLEDAALFFNNPAFSGLVRRFFDHPEDAEAQQQIQAWTVKLVATGQYDLVRLLDTQGVNRLSSPAGAPPISSLVSQRIPEILRSGQVTFQDFHRNEHDRRVYLDILIPLFDEQDARRPLGVFYLRIDPDKYLYPFIQHWPVPSRTAETLLVRRDGNDALFLNELKFRTNTALNLRMSLASNDMPAVKAVLGQEGIVDGTDYRGAPALAALRAVPDSPWFLVARMDTAEVFAPMRARLWQVLVMICVLLFGSWACLGLVWRQQQARFYQAQYESAEALLRDEARFRSLASILQHPATSLQEFLDFALDEAIKLTGSKIGYIYFYHADRKEFVLNTWSKDVMKECKIQNPQTCYELDKTGIWGEAVRQRRPIILNDFQAEHPLKKGYPEGHARLDKYLTIPVFRGDAIVAVVAVANKAQNYDEADVTQLRLLMDAVWRMLERKQAEEALSRSETKFHTLYDSTRDAVMLLDEKGYFDCNPATLTVFGCASREEFCSKHPADVSPPVQPDGTDSLTLASQRIATALEKGGNRFEWMHKRIDTGETFPAEVLLSAMELDGKQVLQAVVRDITARKQAEWEIQHQANFARFNPNPVLELSAAGEINYSNDAAGEMAHALGLENPAQMLPLDTPAMIRECLAAGKPKLRVEKQIGPRVISWSFFPVKFNNLVHGYAGDVTERKRAEEKLRQLSTAVEQSPASIVITDTAGDIEYVNPKFVQVTGYTLVEALGKNPRILKSGEKSPEAYRELWETISSGKEWRGEFHNKKKNGELYWESASISPIRDLADRVTHYVAVKEDITARKQTEAEREQLIHDLQDALASVKSLSGLLPICANCKKIRDDKGYWSQVESYISQHSEATFTHGICPDCIKKLYPDLAQSGLGRPPEETP